MSNSAYSAGATSAPTGAASQRMTATGALAGKQEPHGASDLKWKQNDPRTKLMRRQFWMLVLPVILSGCANIADVIICGLETNGKRIWTTNSFLYWRASVAGLQTLATIVAIYYSINGITKDRNSKTNLYDHKHYSAFTAYATVIWLANIYTFGLQMTFYSYATQDQINLWNDFSVSRYGAVSLEYQRIEGRMMAIYNYVTLSAFIGFALSTFVFAAWMFPAPSEALIKGKYSASDTKSKKAEEVSDNESGGDDDS